MKNYIIKDINSIISSHLSIVQKIEIKSIIKAAEILIKSLKNGNKILICGNGGSAADAQHFAAELVGKFKKKRKALPAIALNNNSSIITSIGNDCNFAEIFSRQIEAYGQKGDVLVAISTSGKSKNILNAVKSANKRSMMTILLTGNNKNIKANHIIKIPSKDTPFIQEAHILIVHILCGSIEKAFS